MIYLGGDIDILVAGSGGQTVAEMAAKVAGVSRVILADNEIYAHHLAENMSLLVTDLAANYSHVVHHYTRYRLSSR